MRAQEDAHAQPEPAQQRPKLRPKQIVRDSVVIYRVHWWRLILSAVVVFLPLAIGDALLEEIDTDHAVATVALKLASGVLDLLGAVFYAGLVTAAVVAWREGREHEGPLRVARHLPWRTMTVLDLLLPFIIVVGLILLVVPGIMAAVYLALAPAFAEIDHTGVRESMRRSIRAVRGSFWRVLLVFVVLVVVSGTVEEILQDTVDHLVGNILVGVLIQAIFAPFYGLAIATMTLDRREVDPSLAGRPRRLESEAAGAG
jgi:hypothetical protein